MANKRNLKKEINFVCSELFAECIAVSTYTKRPDSGGNVNALLKSILRLHSDYIMRVSHPEPGMAAKRYYCVLVESFNKDINNVVDEIGNML